MRDGSESQGCGYLIPGNCFDQWVSLVGSLKLCPDSCSYAARLAELLANIDVAHTNFYKTAVFSGPSFYFHKRALEDGAAGDFSRFAESSYAMLTAWGMHRMGRRGAKMVEFEIYLESLQKAWPSIIGLKDISVDSMKEAEWERLKDAFLSIKAMRSAFSLVANSKVLAHVLPSLVPPVDRQYTIRFLYGGKSLPKFAEDEWSLLRDFLQNFFYPFLADNTFLVAQERWKVSEEKFPWNTSQLKIVDNLLVGYQSKAAIEGCGIPLAESDRYS